MQRRSQALVETALVIVPLTFLLLGLIQFGWMFSEEQKLRMALDHAAEVANVEAYDEYLAVVCQCPGSGIKVVRPVADGVYPENFLRRTSELANKTALEFINLSGGKSGINVATSYEFKGGYGFILVKGSFDIPSLVRAWPLPSSFHFSATGSRALEIVAR